MVCLESHQCHAVYRSNHATCTVVPFKNGALFTDQQKATLYQIDEEENIHIFAGSETEGSLDGLVAECKFKQPMGIAVEFDNVVYMCDPQSNCVKVMTPLSQTAKFLSAIGRLYDAFSVHKKGQSVQTRTLTCKRLRAGSQSANASFLSWKEPCALKTVVPIYRLMDHRGWFPLLL